MNSVVSIIERGTSVFKRYFHYFWNENAVRAYIFRSIIKDESKVSYLFKFIKKWIDFLYNNFDEAIES